MIRDYLLGHFPKQDYQKDTSLQRSIFSLKTFDIVTKDDVCIENLTQLLTSYILHLDNKYNLFDEAATQLVDYLAKEKRTQEKNQKKKKDEKEAKLRKEKEDEKSKEDERKKVIFYFGF